jgi:hypothetical protein
MSNRLYATDRIDTVFGVEGPSSFDQIRILRQAEILRGEMFARMVNVLWRAVRADAELDDHMLADIGVTRQQVPGFAAREVAAAREIVARNRPAREMVHAA